MIEIITKDKCTGCGACLSSCPKHSIQMQFDEEGFEYPVIDQLTCIDCGICKKVCPPLNFSVHVNDRINKNSIQRGFAARNKNIEQRTLSSSGGVFAVLANAVLQKKGFVIGVAFDECFNTVYKIIENSEELHLIQGSKYLQCKADENVFKQIKKILENGNIVLFSGLACQIEGLRAFLRKDYQNLLCVDLICMGIPSSVVWQKYLNAYFPNERVKKVNFKEKSIGWNHFCLAIETERQTFKEWGMITPYFRSMFNTYNMRKSCFSCSFKQLYRYADMTLADCWGANELVSDIDDNKGLSSVIIHSVEGMKWWKMIEDEMDVRELSVTDIVDGNRNMVEHRTCDHEGRNTFYTLLNNGNVIGAFEFARNRSASESYSIFSRLKRLVKKYSII